MHLVAYANPSPSLFSFLLSPCYLYLSFAACWKKLTCGVIRSFNYLAVSLSICLSIYLSIYLYLYLSIYLSSHLTYTSDTPKCNPSQEISALTSQPLSWTCLLYCACHGKCVFADHLQMSHAHACHLLSKCSKTLMFCSLLTRSTTSCACHAKRHLSLQKWSEPLVPHIFVWGSCFWFCIPDSSFSSASRRLPHTISHIQ